MILNFLDQPEFIFEPFQEPFLCFTRFEEKID